MAKKKEKDFEAALTELEEVVKELDGSVKLEKALELFDRGMRLSKECQVFLEGAEEKVAILKKNLDGTVEEEPFEEEGEKEIVVSENKVKEAETVVKSNAATNNQLQLGL